jgi:hypothetical protein
VKIGFGHDILCSIYQIWVSRVAAVKPFPVVLVRSEYVSLLDIKTDAALLFWSPTLYFLFPILEIKIFVMQGDNSALKILH